MPPTSNERRCSWMLCSNQGKLRCSGCRDAEPQTVYCGEGCQKRDWKYHKKYCGRDAYTFDLTLLGTSNPVIKRTFDVPAWYTFRQLHYTLQYAMGPWDCTHLHEFSFTIPPSPPLPPPSSSLSLSSPSSSASTSTLNPTPTPTPTPSSRRPHDVFSKKEGKEVLRIGSKRLYDATRMPIPGEDAKLEMEESVLLQDVFDPAGKLYELVGGGGKGKTSGEVCALTYVYDFGDFWEHELVFKGKKLAREERPVFSSAEGCGPIEDCGSPSGWNRIKAAFRKPPSQRTETETDLVRWAQQTSGLEAKFDPFKDPDVVQMNYEGRWENHLEHYMKMEGEALPEREWGEDEDDEDEDGWGDYYDSDEDEEAEEEVD